jgi:hypothetical protein
VNDYTCGMCDFEVKGQCYVMPPVVVLDCRGARPSVRCEDHPCKYYLRSVAKAAEKKRDDIHKARLEQIEVWRKAGCCLSCGGSPEEGKDLCVSCQEAQDDAESCPGCGCQSNGDLCDGCRDAQQE